MSKEIFDFGSSTEGTFIAKDWIQLSMPFSMEDIKKALAGCEEILNEEARKLLPGVVEQWGLEDAKALLLSEPAGEAFGYQVRQSRRLSRDCMFLILGSQVIKVKGLSYEPRPLA